MGDRLETVGGGGVVSRLVRVVAEGEAAVRALDLLVVRMSGEGRRGRACSCAGGWRGGEAAGCEEES